ncbi:hypothetical protein CDL15_Pgr011973 [Punica granatum]|uniref:Glyoxal oxidase N-terminal domain-containing protein n=1 Tax=Punica granatum TaxID=22663 RepID=A0A218WCA9_PUNGR|nr:hypothetical protein CDL15_Pgr011973 [Punica granatum]
MAVTGTEVQDQFVALYLLSLLLSPDFVLAGLLSLWELLDTKAGIASMHTTVTRFNNVILLDSTDICPSLKLLPKGYCNCDPTDPILKLDWYAPAAVLDLITNAIYPFMIFTKVLLQAIPLDDSLLGASSTRLNQDSF